MALGILFIIAFLYGAVHAIGPGHGKLLIISYFTSHRDKWWRGVFMGFEIAFMHIISAVILVLLTDGVAKQAFGNSPSKEMISIKLISYAAIAIVGLIMILNTYKDQKRKSKPTSILNKNNKSQWLLSISIGLVPCTGAMLFLFYTMSQQMLFTGICIVLSMGLGIAISLSLIGIICILTRKSVSDFSVENKNVNRFSKYLRYLGYFLILIIGLLMFIKEIYKVL
jgi:ABC-type nickel/cobalt efflux system permease component RcnA